MPASTEPHFGEMWRYADKSLWMFVAPAGGKWSVLYFGHSPIVSPMSLWMRREREGHSILDEMWGPGTEAVAEDWERVS